jgi:rSAM/selenodomain-associated transferase 1
LRTLDAEAEDAEVTGTIALALMCKAPIDGESKTRLCPPLTPGEAAALSACFIADVAASVAEAAAAGNARGYAMIAPAGMDAAFAGLLPEGVSILPQRGADLSARLINATGDLLAAGHAGVCFINADGPTLPPALLAMAVTALREPDQRVVLVPAIDGGYALIGINLEAPGLFADIAWSTSQVLAQTLARAARLGLPVSILPPWYDVDDAAGLELLCQELFDPAPFPLAGCVRPAAALRTRAFLAALLEDDGTDRPGLAAISRGAGLRSPLPPRR